jgi:hypothetical protein
VNICHFVYFTDTQFSEADLARSLLFTISNDVGQVASLYAMMHKLNKVKQSLERYLMSLWAYYLELPYILESNPHPFYSFRGLKNQMRIRIECGLDSRSRAGIWKNYRAGVLTFFRLRRRQKPGAD